MRDRSKLYACVLGLALPLAACGSDDNDMMMSAITAAAGGMTAAGTGGAGGTPLAGTGGGGVTGGIAGAAGVMASGGASGAAGSAGAGAGGMMSTGGSAGAMASGAGGMSMPIDGPVDGDPATPMVEVPGVPCGPPNVGFGSTPPSVQIGGRDVVVAYPCMHEGAQVTFFLFIHGTLQDAQKVQFTMAAFPIHKNVDTDNVIVVVPKAIGTQWGREDDGKDLPHLYEVVDWVYATFGEKVNIRSMWASGGSWGAFYLGTTFACDPRFQDRLKGVRMVVGGGCPPCTDRLACIVAQQELELGMDMPLSDEAKEMAVQRANIESYSVTHGCDARTGPTNLGPVRAWTWPNCDPGFAHSYYLGPGQHADRWDDPGSLQPMIDEIKSIEH